MVNDWDIFKNRQMPTRVWDYLKKKSFWINYSKEYGGLGFYRANSRVIAKCASHQVQWVLL